jgi:hypothetical protein
MPELDTFLSALVVGFLLDPLLLRTIPISNYY